MCYGNFEYKTDGIVIDFMEITIWYSPVFQLICALAQWLLRIRLNVNDWMLCVGKEDACVCVHWKLFWDQLTGQFT